MNDKKNIDKLFKDALSNDGLSYKTAYWEQMSSLLDKEEVGFWQKNKMGFISLAALLALSIFSLVGAEREVVKPLASETAHFESSEEVDNEAKAAENKESSSTEGPSEGSTTSAETHVFQSSGPIITTVNPSELVVAQATEPSLNATTLEDKLEEPEEAMQFSALAHKLLPFGLESIPYHLKSPKKKNEPDYFQKPYRGQLFLESFIGQNSFDRRLSGNYPSLKSAEAGQRSMDYGFRLGWKKGNMALLTGLGFTSFKSSNPYETYNTSWQLDSSYKLITRTFQQRSNGQFAGLLQLQIDSTAQVDTNVCLDCQAQFNYLSIPIQFRYEIPYQAFQFYLQAGINVNPLLSVKGEYVTEAQQQTYTSLNAAQDVQSVFLQWNAGAGLRHEWQTGVGIFAEFQYRQGLGSMMRNYEQKAVNQQLRLGLQWPLR